MVGIVRDILAPGVVYVTPAVFATATEFKGAVNAVRVALSDHADIASSIADIAAALSTADIKVKTTLTAKSFSAAQGAHIGILVWALGMIAAVMAVVGLLGLASSLGNSVIERTREFGIMRALGASNSVVVRSVLYEGVLTAFASVLVAVPAAVLPSTVVGSLLATISNQPMALAVSPPAIVFWLTGVLAAAVVISYFPAARASRLTVKQTFDWQST